MPNDFDQLLSRLDSLDSKFDDLRKELMASFVLKQVFDVVMSARDKELEAIKTELDQHRQEQLGRGQRYVIIAGGLVGMVSALITIYQHLRP